MTEDTKRPDRVQEAVRAFAQLTDLEKGCALAIINAMTDRDDHPAWNARSIAMFEMNKRIQHSGLPAWVAGCTS